MSPTLLKRGFGLAVVLACAGTTACSPARTASHHRVDIRQLTYQPGELEVQVGDTLSWINHDIVPHTVTSAEGAWDSEEMIPGATYSLVAHKADTVRYVCRFHPSMTGTLVVR